MKNYKNFDRHESMPLEVRDQIGEILNTHLWEEGITREMRKSVDNQLYGLYDGFLYNSLLINAMNLPDPLRTKIVDLWLICNTYPEAITNVW